jgi:hypothetical protein
MNFVPSGHHQRALHPVVTLSLILFVIVLSISPVATFAQYDEQGMEAEKWLLSQHEFRNLVIIPDITLPQWNDARMLTVEQIDGIKINLMSVHNNTYVVILVQREMNTSLNRSGVALDFNASQAVWAWVAGQQILINDIHVESMASLNNETLTVAFGRPIHSNGSGIEFNDETPYSGFVKVVTWDNASELSSISFSRAPTLGLELLPYITPYPTPPLLYSTVILLAGFGFVLLEARKYRSPRL